MRRVLFAMLAILPLAAFAGAFEDGVAALSRDDHATAAKHFSVAAEAGNADAQFNLGLFYANGRGVEKNDATAVNWYRKSAEQGHSLAQGNLAFMISVGRGVKQDDQEAVLWYMKAAERGSATAQYVLGVRYWQGRGVERNDKLAVQLLQLASLQGHPHARQALRQMFNTAVDMSQKLPADQPIGMDGK